MIENYKKNKKIKTKTKRDTKMRRRKLYMCTKLSNTQQTDSRNTKENNIQQKNKNNTIFLQQQYFFNQTRGLFYFIFFIFLLLFLI